MWRVRMLSTSAASSLSPPLTPERAGARLGSGAADEGHCGGDACALFLRAVAFNSNPSVCGYAAFSTLSPLAVALCARVTAGLAGQAPLPQPPAKDVSDRDAEEGEEEDIDDQGEGEGFDDDNEDGEGAAGSPAKKEGAGRAARAAPRRNGIAFLQVTAVVVVVAAAGCSACCCWCGGGGGSDMARCELPASFFVVATTLATRLPPLPV